MKHTVICRTTGCRNVGVALLITLSGVDDDGVPWVAAGVVCGPCGQPILDITPPLPAPPPPEPDPET